MARDDLKSCLDAACEAARRGAAVLESFRGRLQVREKARADLVTDADLGSQQVIRAYLQERFPTHQFLGEEEDGSGRPDRDGAPTWIVDPLDGTTNYVHDVPLYCVSIGLVHRGEPLVGVVYDPRHEELFHAARGHGAFLGERRLRVSDTEDLSQALLATGFPPDVAGQERSLHWWKYFSFRARSLRRTGSTALNLAYLAAGRYDGYWAFDNHPWDVAGGFALVLEAGGILTRADGSPPDPFAPDSVAGNRRLHAQLLAALRGEPAS
jgi:myo-inositol-1(or 4)-monophosphatase